MDDPPFCFAITFNKFDTVNDDYDIEFSFAKENVPDTNQPAYNTLVKSPDLANYDLWFQEGAPAIYAYITEFVARAKMPVPDYTNPIPLYN